MDVRAGAWKYISPKAGFKPNPNGNPDRGDSADGQLYDVSADPGEKKNVLAEHPDKAAELKEILEKTRGEGRMPMP